MISVSMAIFDRELRSEVQSCLRDEPVQIGVDESAVAPIGPFLESLQRANPDVVLFDVSALKDPPHAAIERLKSAVPDSMLVALNTSATSQAVLDCFRAGADEYLFPPLQEGLKKTLARRINETSKKQGKVISFLPVTGGCGATTMACHVARELQRVEHNTLLADLDPDGGMVAFLTKAASPYSIRDAINNVHRLDASYWKALVTAESSGLEIIAAARTIGAEDKLDGLRRVIEFTRTQYGWVVLDAGEAAGLTSLTTLDCSDEVFLVTTNRIAALHRAKEMLQRLMDRGRAPERVHLILNRVPKRPRVTPDEVQEMLGLQLYAIFPEAEGEFYEAYSQGQLLGSGTEMGYYFSRFVRKLAGVQQKKPAAGFHLFR